MSSLGVVLKNEITRIARKELKAQLEPLRKANAGYRRDVAALKRRVVELDREVKSLRKIAKPAAAQTATDDGPGARLRISGKGVRSLRERLGISQRELGLLTGASSQSVYNWEHDAMPRSGALAALAALRSVGKKEVRARLDAIANPPGKRAASTR